MFYEQQQPSKQQAYVDHLTLVGGLSNLFSDSSTPYLHYRVAENIFCKSFDASNESRADVSFDAVKDGTGIGIKTFLFRNSQIEKVAEFNRSSQRYTGLSDIEMVKLISADRNERISAAHRIYGTNRAVYHCVARKRNEFMVYEVPMELIDIDHITSISSKRNVVVFHDGNSQYSFNISKSTLYKKFIPSSVSVSFPVEIVDDPYAFLSGVLQGPMIENVVKAKPARPSKLFDPAESNEVVILPLYSTRNGATPEVQEKSGLNQWNAAGRTRNNDEAYIQIPAWIHQKFPDFFPGRDTAFTLLLPNGHKMSASVCQDGGKALMSNPNRELGKWLLRDILKLGEHELLIYDRLVEIGIDSVEIQKLDELKFRINFRALGTFEDFKVQNGEA